MRTEVRRRVRQLQWLRFARGYLELVRADLARNPADRQLRVLLREMERALAPRVPMG
jgi:hypothetical protein